MCPDHVRPKYIIVVKVEEAISLPPFLDKELLLPFLSWKANTKDTSVEDLKGNQCLVNNDRVTIPRPLEH